LEAPAALVVLGAPVVMVALVPAAATAVSVATAVMRSV
jgi:hypothetical protein